jgi:adenylosuccinate synthase
MKDSIIEYVERIEKRIKALQDMLDEATDNQTRVRLEAKKSVYKDVIHELNHLIQDENNS